MLAHPVLPLGTPVRLSDVVAAEIYLLPIGAIGCIVAVLDVVLPEETGVPEPTQWYYVRFEGSILWESCCLADRHLEPVD